MPETPTDQSTPLTDTDRPQLSDSIDIYQEILHAPVIGEGASGNVYRISLPVDGTPRNFALKVFDDKTLQQAEEYGIDLGDNLAQLYAKAKAAQLPVMSTFEVIKRNGKTVGFLMEDLTDGGKNFVFNAKNLFITLPEEKGYSTGIEDPFPGSREQLPENQRHLLELFCQNINLSPNSPLLAESLGLANKAAGAGFYFDALSIDAPFYCLTPEGTIRIVFPAELSGIQWGTFDDEGTWTPQLASPSPAPSNSLEKEAIIRQNTSIVISAFAAMYRYQQIKSGADPTKVPFYHWNYYLPYTNAAREHFKFTQEANHDNNPPAPDSNSDNSNNSPSSNS